MTRKNAILDKRRNAKRKTRRSLPVTIAMWAAAFRQSRNEICLRETAYL